MMKYVVKFKIWFLDKPGFIYRLYFFVFIFAVLGFIDYKNLLAYIPQLKFLNVLSIIKSSSDLILFWTFLIILVYSIETYRLRDETYTGNILSSEIRREMTMANQISIQPGLILEYFKDGS